MWKLNEATGVVQWWNPVRLEWVQHWRGPTAEEINKAINEFANRQHDAAIPPPQQVQTTTDGTAQFTFPVPEFTPDLEDNEDDDPIEFNEPRQEPEQQLEMKTELEEREEAIDMEISGWRAGANHARYGGEPYKKEQLTAMVANKKLGKVYATAWEKGYNESKAQKKTKSQSWEALATKHMIAANKTTANW